MEEFSQSLAIREEASTCFVAHEHNETTGMESISLTFLPTLLFCFVSVAVVTASGMDLRDEPIIRTSSVRLNDKGRHLPIQSDFNNPNERIFRRPEVSNKRPFSGNSKSRWNSNRNPDPSFRNSPPRKSPNSKSKPSTANFDQVVEDLFPGLFTTTRRPPISTKKAKQPVNEIHVQINDVADLSNLLGYDDIVFEIDPPLRSPPSELQDVCTIKFVLSVLIHE